MKSQPKVILSLAPTALDAARVQRGTVVARTRVALNPDEWSDLWEQSLLPLDGPLADALRAVGASRNPSVCVLCETPSDRIEVLSVPGDESDPVAYGRKRFAERLDLHADHPAIGARLLCRSSGDKTQVLLAGDTDANLQRVFGWLNRVGARLDGVVTMKSAVLNAGLGALERDGTGNRMLIYMDSGYTAVVCRGDGGLRLARVFGIGTRALADAFRRGAADGQAPAADGAGEHVRALEMLGTCGVPGEGAPISGSAHPLRNRVVPMLSPVIQRFLVEVKQTIRFGLGGGHTLDKSTLGGPGAFVPGLASLIGEGLESAVTIDTGECCEGSQVPFGDPSAARNTVMNPAETITLCPNYMLEAKREVLSRRALIAGAALPIAAAVGLLSHVAISTLRVENDQAAWKPELMSVEHLEQTQGRAAELGVQLGVAAEHTESRFGAQPDWELVLEAIAQSCGSRVRIEEIRASTGTGGPTAQIIGLVTTEAGDRTDDRAELGAFIERLNAHEAIDAVRIGSTSLREHTQGSARAFTVEIDPIRASLQDLHAGLPTIADSNGGDR